MTTKPKPASRRKPEAVQIITTPPLSVRADAGALLLGIGEAMFWKLVSQGILPRPKKLGQASIWLVDDLRGCLHNLPTDELTKSNPQ